MPRRGGATGGAGRGLRQALARAVQVFRQARAPYMLIGAWALGVCGRPRATLDLDFMVMVDADELTRLGARMTTRGLTVDEEWLDWNPMLRGSQLRLRFETIAVDVLRPRDDHDRKAFKRRRRHRWERRSYWFVAPEDLVLQKLKVGRPRDFEDAAGILRRSGPKMDARYLRRWASRLGIAAELEHLRRPLGGGV